MVEKGNSRTRKVPPWAGRAGKSSRHGRRIYRTSTSMVSHYRRTFRQPVMSSRYCAIL